MGIGIIVSTLILMVSFSQQKNDISDEEIIMRAKALGMVMKEDKLFGNKEENTLIGTGAQTESLLETEMSEETEVLVETEHILETEIAKESETTEVRAYYQLEIFAGDMPRQICALLEENGVIENGESLRQYLNEVGIAKYIPVGKYEIPFGATNAEIYQIIKNGPSR